MLLHAGHKFWLLTSSTSRWPLCASCSKITIFRIMRRDAKITTVKEERDPERTFMATEKLAKVANERRRHSVKIVTATNGPKPLSVSAIKSFNLARFLAICASRRSSPITFFGGFSSSLLIFWSCKNVKIFFTCDQQIYMNNVFGFWTSRKLFIEM